MLAQSRPAWPRAPHATVGDARHDPPGISRLPPEMLAHCFLFLPPHLLDRLPILHVSRKWRVTALHFPQLWSTVMMHGGAWDAHRLVSLVLANTGLYPIDFRYVCVPEDNSRMVYAVLHTHMHHMRSVRWHGACDRPLLFTRTAPLLEHLQCSALNAISPQFLGGIAGCLHVLETGRLTLPLTCPALSTLTTLRCTPSGDFTPLFSVCPRLQTLSLTIAETPGTKRLRLPPSPPESLLRLELSTSLYTSEAVALSGAWRTHHLRSIALEIIIPYNGALVLLDGLIELSITIHTAPAPCSIVRLGALTLAGQRISMNLRHRNRLTQDISSRIAHFLLCRPRDFTRVRRLHLSACFLQPFLHDVPALPSLDELHVVLAQHPICLRLGGPYTYTFAWEQLNGLASALLRFPGVHTVTVAIQYQPGEPPRRLHALRTVERIQWICRDRARLATSFVVTGFPDALLRTMDADSDFPQCREPSIIFK